VFESVYAEDVDIVLYNYAISCGTNFTGEAKNSLEKSV